MSEGSLKIKKLHFEWSIEKFSSHQEATGKSIESPTFTTSGNDELKLKLYPNGDKEKVKDQVSLFLYAASTTKWIGQFEFSILNSQGRKCNCETFQRMIPTVGYGFPEFISRIELFSHTNDLLPNDKLTICCQVKNVSGCPGDSKQAQLQVAIDLEQILDEPTLSDVTFVVNGRNFQAHRIILAARSPVFGALFQNEFREMKIKSTVDIVDIDADVFEELLRFVYTGRVNQLEQLAEHLLFASNKYDMRELKTMCEDELSRRLSVENAARTLILSDLHSSRRLKCKAIHFINQHSTDVVETPGWKDLVETHPKLVADIYVKLVKK